MRPGDLDAVCEFDRRMTGEDRAHLLRTLEGPGWVADDGGEVRGYLLPVPWGGGPIRARDLADGRTFARLARTLAGPGGTVRFWLAGENEAGIGFMEEIGFQEIRRLSRMARGMPLSWRPESPWGIFSLGKG